jgi:hypothetical protein
VGTSGGDRGNFYKTGCTISLMAAVQPEPWLRALITNNNNNNNNNPHTKQYHTPYTTDTLRLTQVKLHRFRIKQFLKITEITEIVRFLYATEFQLCRNESEMR